MNRLLTVVAMLTIAAVYVVGCPVQTRDPLEPRRPPASYISSRRRR